MSECVGEDVRSSVDLVGHGGRHGATGEVREARDRPIVEERKLAFALDHRVADDHPQSGTRRGCGGR